MNPQNTTVANIYNPSQLSEEELIERFIVRKKIFSKLFKFISEADMKYPETHFLIEGQRGMGKTTLLLRLYYAVKNEPELNTWLVPVIFSEELYGVRTLTDFWETVAEGLEEEEAGFFGLSDKIEQLRDQCDSEDDCERFVFDLLDKQLEQGGKKVILFVDNFVDLIKNMPKKQIQRFREVLQTSPNFRVFVASSVILQSIMEYKEPFYEFFKVERLEGLDKQETENLLLALGKHYKQEKIEQIIREQPGRVETLRRLTGGITRT
ncbi:MAG: Cdc6-like AAA superfamily ATPase, partial [Flammeovirgaceae bacterium]